MSRDAVLEHVRRLVNNVFEQANDPNKNQQQSLESPSANGGDIDKLLMDWCFIDCEQRNKAVALD